jgi:hypothetical protein
VPTGIPQSNIDQWFLAHVCPVPLDTQGRVQGYKLWIGDLSPHCTNQNFIEGITANIEGAILPTDVNVQHKAQSGAAYAIVTWATQAQAHMMAKALIAMGTAHTGLTDIIGMRVQRFPLH